MGKIFSTGDQLYDARRAVEQHVSDAHGDRLETLLGEGKDLHGLSDIQVRVIEGMYRGSSDREIAVELGGRAISTVRNHRFQLQKRRREAENFLAIMALLDSRMGTRESSTEEMVSFHDQMPVRDERTFITRGEAEALEASYLDRKNGLRLLKFPRKEKAKLVVLKSICDLFETGRRYSEAQINEELKTVTDDYATIRRYLIEYRFLQRSPGGREYWRS